MLNNEKIIRTIGETGVFRLKDLRTILIKENEGISEKEIAEILRNLEEIGDIERERVTLNSKAGYDYRIFKLSKRGQEKYKIQNGREPIVSKLNDIIKGSESLDDAMLREEFVRSFKRIGIEAEIKENDEKAQIVIKKDQKECAAILNRERIDKEEMFKELDAIYEGQEKQKDGKTHIYILSSNQRIEMRDAKRIVFLWIKDRLGGFQNAKNELVVYFTTFDRAKAGFGNIFESKAV